MAKRKRAAPAGSTQRKAQKIMPPKNTYVSFFTSPIVTITAGTEGNYGIFSVHQDIICDKSDYFRKALICGLKETQTKEINMVEDNPEDVELFIEWAYSHNVPDDDFSDPHEVIRRLVNFYIFATKICQNNLADQIIEQLVSYLRSNRLYLLEGSSTYEKLLPGKGLANLITDCHAYIQMASDASKSNVESSLTAMQQNAQLSVAVIVRMSELSNAVFRPNPVRTSSGCQYHLHAKEEECSIYEGAEQDGKKLPEPAAPKVAQKVTVVAVS